MTPTHRCSMCSLVVSIPLAPGEMYYACPQVGCAGKLVWLVQDVELPEGHA